MTPSTQITPRAPSAYENALEEALRNDPNLRSDHTFRQYKSALMSFNAWLNGREATKTMVEAYAARLQREGLAVDSINLQLSAIRWQARRFIAYAEDHPSDDNARIAKQAARVLAVENLKGGGQEQRGRHMDPAELTSLLAACDADPSPAGRRDKAIIWLDWSNGLRRQTLCDLELSNLEHWDFNIDGQIRKGARIRYTSKRKKKGYAYLLEDAWLAMLAWLEVRGSDPGPIFAQVNKSDKVIVRKEPLTGEAIRLWLEARFAESGLDKHTTWHDFRYTFAGNLLDEGYDISTVQKLMLHASPTQTQRYDRRKERHQAEAVLSLSRLSQLGE